MTEEKRIINWNAGMQSDFHYLASNSENGACLLYNFMSVDEEDYPSLSVYYHSLNNEDKIQFAQDLIDLYVGKAKFLEQLYYVKLPKLDDFPWLSKMDDGEFNLYEDKDRGIKQQFTMSEIEAIDPRYKAFAIPVSEVNE